MVFQCDMYKKARYVNGLFYTWMVPYLLGWRKANVTVKTHINGAEAVDCTFNNDVTLRYASK
jgi:hypothetical protein